MKSETDELVQRLRQQLILAQVRIMELEDGRDELTPRLASLEKLLTAAQTLADQQSDKATHLENVLAELQQQFEHMRHMQHVTNEALENTRAELTAVNSQKDNLLSEVEHLQSLIKQQAEQTQHQQEELHKLSARLQTAQAESAARLERICQLDSEQHAMKASRSWRWTVWLRSLERALSRPKP